MRGERRATHRVSAPFGLGTAQHGRSAVGPCYRHPMCRSIKTLRRPDDPATDEEIRAAALQFVRKVSGYGQPSRANAAAFEAAVDEVSVASRRLLEALVIR